MRSTSSSHSFLCLFTNTKQNLQYSDTIYNQTKKEINNKGNQYVITAAFSEFKTSFLDPTCGTKQLSKM